MSYTIFTSNPTALIPQPGRAVNTFPSGLVRVDQTYLGLTSQAATHRATLAVGNVMPDGDQSPAIDLENPDGTNYGPSLKIFPDVQESRREDGFTDYKVSAYGQANADGTTSRGLSLEKYSKSFSIDQGPDDPPIQYTITEFWEIETVSIRKTISATETMEDFPSAPANLFKRLRNRIISGSPPQGQPSTLTLNWTVVILNAIRTNFGHIDELTLTFGYDAN